MLAVLVMLAPGLAAVAQSPYPSSTAIPTISFRWQTVISRAPGSDNWPLTWSANDHQYAAFGDGGGFGGTEQAGRVSLGVSRIEGSATDYQGHNVWGGVDAESPATFTGKSYGMLALGTDLYMWRCGAGSNSTAFDFQQLHLSTDNGRSWRAANWLFPGSVTFYCPTFLQAGKGHADAPDQFVYMYASERTNEAWQTHQPGRVALMRAPRERLMERAAYEFFAGRNADGAPIWSADVADRRPVLEDPNGARLASATYNQALGRYLVATEHAPRASGAIGIFDAPDPWGPWTTVLYTDSFGAGQVPGSTFFVNFAPKWWSADGRNFVLAFTGTGGVDSWNTVQGSLTRGRGDDDDDGDDGDDDGCVDEPPGRCDPGNDDGGTDGSGGSGGSSGDDSADDSGGSSGSGSLSDGSLNQADRTAAVGVTPAGRDSGGGFVPSPEPPIPAGDPDASYATYSPPEPAAPRERVPIEASPPPQPAAPSNEPRLVGTMRRGDDWQAWVVPPEKVEPIIVRQGGTVGGWEVVGIESSALKLRQGDRIMSLRMFEPPGTDTTTLHEIAPADDEAADAG